LIDLKANSNKIINVHLLASVMISMLIYFLYQPFFAISFAAGSLTFNIYLRLLQGTFWLALAAKLNFDVENKSLLMIFSAFRTFLIAAILVLLILKLKFNLIALVSAFICYNIIVIIASILINQALIKKTN
jgi:hypothetical protein